MTAAVLFASSIGKVFEPLFKAMAYLLAFFYAIIPNYAIAIALLTLLVMAVTAPLNIKSTKSMLAMQRVAPEIKKLQQKYKDDKVLLSEETMKLYRENNISPAGGCVPLLITMPFFIVLYGVIRGLTNTVVVHGQLKAEPRYISSSTKLYQSLVAHPGQMKAFGINLADKLFSHQAHWYLYIPYVVLVLAAIGLQYLQMHQMNTRNPAAAQANPQMQAITKWMPIAFGYFYIVVPAGVNIYFIVSTSCRIAIQEYVFKSGTLDKPPKARRAAPGGGAAPRRTLMDRLADAQKRALEQQEAVKRARDEGGGEAKPALTGAEPAAPEDKPAGGPSPSPADKGSTNGSNGSAPTNGSTPKPSGTAKSQPPRSRSKRKRKAR